MQIVDCVKGDKTQSSRCTDNKKDFPLVSVIIPVYQAEKTLKRCVNSVLLQTYQDFEIILIDDGSTDNSNEICDEFAKKEKRIKVIHQQNKGVSAARNAGIEASYGRYLTFLDSDDCLKKDFIERFWRYITTTNVDIVIGALHFICKDKEYSKGMKEKGVLGNEVWNDICLDSEPFGWAGGKLIRADIIKNNKLYFDEKMYSQEDLNFFIEVYRYCEYFYLTEYDGYEYYYVPSNRVPATCDYIQNQLKLLQYATRKSKLSKAANEKVLDRIDTLIFVSLYLAESKRNFFEMIDKIKNIKGIEFRLNKVFICDERGVVVWLLAKELDKILYGYMVARKKMKQLFTWRKKKRDGRCFNNNY